MNPDIPTCTACGRRHWPFYGCITNEGRPRGGMALTGSTPVRSTTPPPTTDTARNGDAE